MAPLKAVAVLVGTAGVSGVVHFQQEGEGYGFFPSGSCFLFFLALSSLTAFLFTPYLEERFSKGLSFFGRCISVLISLRDFETFDEFFALILNVNGVMD
jgi:hypothetical protein